MRDTPLKAGGAIPSLKAFQRGRRFLSLLGLVWAGVAASQIAGVEVDLARGFGEHLDRPLVFVRLPWEDQIEELNEGKTDIIMSSMSITPARGRVVAYLAGLYGGDGLASVPILLSEEPLGWAVHRGDETLLKSANDYIEQAIQDGSLVRVFRRWGATGK